MSRIYSNRGVAQLNEGMLDQALVDIQRATKLNSRKSSDYFNLGIAYLKTGQHEQAVLAFSRAIALDQEQKTTQNFRFYFGRASALEASGRLREAAADYRSSCSIAGKGCDKTNLGDVRK